MDGPDVEDVSQTPYKLELVNDLVAIPETSIFLDITQFLSLYL